MRKTLYSNKHMFIRYFMWRNANKMHFEHAKMVNFELMHCFLGYVQHKPIGLKILSPYHLGWLPGCVNFSLKNRRPGVFCDWIRESYFPPPKKKEVFGMNSTIAQIYNYKFIWTNAYIYIYLVWTRGPLQQRVIYMKGYGSGYLVRWDTSNPFHRRTGDLRTGRARTGREFSPTKKGGFPLPETHSSPLKIGELEDPFFRGELLAFMGGYLEDHHT